MNGTTEGLKHRKDTQFLLLGEATTTRFTRDRDSQQFGELKKDAKDGDKVAGSTTIDIEQRLGKSVVSEENYLEKPESEKYVEHKKNE